MPMSNAERTNRTDWGREARATMRGRCMGCGTKQSTHIHEIERRSQSPTRWAHRSNYLLLCRVCHAGAFDSMPHAEQLAYKLFWDPEHYDLDAWLRLRDPELKAPLRVMAGSVTYFLTDLRCKFDG